MKKMINIFQHYSWGSKNMLTQLYGINNFSNQPIAELWMSAYFQNSSKIIDEYGNESLLNTFIKKNPKEILGKKVNNRFGELPFLVKLLFVKEPLSMQVHPDINTARLGYIKENNIGIPFKNSIRNYKDMNHKPEFIFAITPFQAINGFRELLSIVSILNSIENAHPAIKSFCVYPDIKHLIQLFHELLTMTGKQKYLALNHITSLLYYNHGQPWDTIRMIYNLYPKDNSLFLPLLLNIIDLQPGQAMFLLPQTPHAYLKGVALEVTANSDNILRAGLTSKQVNLTEFIKNIKYLPQSKEMLITQSVQKEDHLIFSIPVDDFSFSLHQLTMIPQTLAQESAAILFCLDGQAILNCYNQQLKIQSGESIFISAIDSPITIIGSGSVVRIYNELL